MIKIYFVLAIASIASASTDTCPIIREYIATKPLVLAKVQENVATLEGLQAKANEDYAKLLFAEGEKYRAADKTALEESQKCGPDSECLARVAEWLRRQNKDMTDQIGLIKTENKQCNEAFAFVYSTQIGAGVAKSIRQLIGLYPQNVRLVGDVNIHVIEDKFRDSELFNLLYAKKTTASQYSMGNVGIWYDLETPNGIVRVAGVASGALYTYYPKKNLSTSLKEIENELIPSYGLDLDRLTTKFVKGQIKYQQSYYSYLDSGKFGSAWSGLLLVTFDGAL